MYVCLHAYMQTDIHISHEDYDIKVYSLPYIKEALMFQTPLLFQSHHYDAVNGSSNNDKLMDLHISRTSSNHMLCENDVSL